MATSKQVLSRFDARLTVEQKREFERAMVLGGYRSLTEFVLSSAQEKAKELIEEDKRIVASERDARLFFDVVMKPSKPNAALRKALVQFKKMAE